ncbi:Arf GTPase activating protein [Penicillium malachiteum]|nr:Arf GTPase activating protein [Penicillium malachiteum]
MSRMWEVDPETRTKREEKQISGCGKLTADSGSTAPSDLQDKWQRQMLRLRCPVASMGTHRGLGVHISFVRSITMDAFKHAEIQRMELGGNEPWKAFYDAHDVTLSEGRTFEDSTIKERYEGDAGEEWKERLSCKVEGKEYVLGQEKKNNTSSVSRSSTPMSVGTGGVGPGRTASPAGGMSRTSSLRAAAGAGAGPGAPGKKEQNEAYFAKLGSENATRSDNLPPSQGGKFTGFGGGLPPSAPAGDRRSSPFGGFGGFGGGAGGNQVFDDFQKDPMASITKGFGWFASAVGKSAKTVNDSYLQPTAKQLAESDFAAQARVQAASWGQNLQAGARGAADQFNRFVEGDESRPAGQRARVEPERRDFWDDFSSLGAQDQAGSHRRSGSRSGVVGTAAMRKTPATNSSLANSSTPTSAETTTAPSGLESTETTTSNAKAKDDWDDNW